MQQEVLGQLLAPHSTRGYNDVLDAVDLLWGEGLCGVNLHPLNPCPILDRGRFVESMLGRDWFGVLVLHEGFVYVPGHVTIDVSLQVVPG